MEETKLKELSAQENEKNTEGGSMRSFAQAAVRAMNEYAARGDLTSARAAVGALWELGDYQKENKNLSGAESSYKRMEQFCFDLPEELRGKESDRWLAVSCNKLGSLCERAGDAAQAREYYARALEISERLAAEDNSEEARDDLAVANYRLGFIEYLFSGEKSRLDKADKIWAELYEQTGNYEFRRRRSVIETLFATADVPHSAAEEKLGAEDFAADQNAPVKAKKGRKGGTAAVIIFVAAALIIAAVCIWLMGR